LEPDRARLAAGPEAGPRLDVKPATGPLRADEVRSVSPRALDRRITKPSPIVERFPRLKVAFLDSG
jgi:hypothetical protein